MLDIYFIAYTSKIKGNLSWRWFSILLIVFFYVFRFERTYQLHEFVADGLNFDEVWCKVVFFQMLFFLLFMYFMILHQRKFKRTIKIVWELVINWKNETIVAHLNIKILLTLLFVLVLYRSVFMKEKIEGWGHIICSALKIATLVYVIMTFCFAVRCFTLSILWPKNRILQ